MRLTSTYLFLIYSYSSYSGLAYVKIAFKLLIGNKSGLPDKMLKQTPISLISLLNGVPELN